MEENKDKEYYFNKGNEYLKKGEYKKAIENFTKAIELDERDKEAYFNRGLAYSCLEEYEKAIEDFTNAIDIDEKHKDAYFFRGNIYNFLEEYEKAIEDFTKVIDIDKKSKEAYFNRGLAYGKLKKYEKAIEDFTKFIELDEKYKEVYFFRGLSYYSLEEYKKAIKDFKKAIELDKKYKEVYFYIGIVYSLLKNYKRAIKDFNKFIDLDKIDNVTENKGKNENNILSNISFTDNVLNFLYDILIDCKWDLESEEKKILVALIINSYKLIEKFEVNEPKQFLHYTKATTLKFLLHNEKDMEKDKNEESIFPKLRLNNAVYMNDPEEGKFFKKILLEMDKNNNELNKNFKTFDDEDLLNNKDYTYLTCFAPVEEKDKLPMWVHYGDGGKGVSIVFNEKFFKSTELYKVKYLDIKDIYNDDIYIEVENIYNVLKNVNSEKEIFLQLTNVILNYVSYLFKDKAYSYEQEVRIIKLRDYNDVKIDKQYDIPKLYIDFETPITNEMIDEIIIGPKGDFETILAYAKYVGIKKVSKSNIKYR